jgi:hypothetical protein
MPEKTVIQNEMQLEKPNKKPCKVWRKRDRKHCKEKHFTVHNNSD